MSSAAHIDVKENVVSYGMCHYFFLFCNTGPTGDKSGSAPLSMSLHQVQQAEGEKSRRGSIQHSRTQCLHQG